MDRRDFLILAGWTSAAAIALSLAPVSMSASAGVVRRDRPIPRTMLHGSKRLGCSGHDFPFDESVLESGQFMPHA